jgi:hypothetical protein
MEFRALNEFSSDVYSQFGEDGIIAEVLDRIEMVQPLTRWCVEFGAHDGVFMSNTCNLARSRRFRAVMIESDPRRARELAVSHPQPEVIKITATVGFDGDNRLDRILASTPIPKEFDLLSIDIDGCDYWILDSIEDYRPSVIVVEFNPTIPNAVEFVQPRDISVQQGSSASALLRLAESKGYELVAVTEVNLIVVRSDLRDAVMGPGADKVALEALRDDSSVITYAFAGFDGTLLFSSPEIFFPWHYVAVDTSRIQPIPKFWRTFRGNWKNLGLRFQTWKIFRRHTRRFLPPKNQ